MVKLLFNLSERVDKINKFVYHNLLEFDGQQHYLYSGGWNTREQLLNTQRHDTFKNKWCDKHNIPLIRIPYWAVDELTIADLLLNSRFLYQGGEQEDGEDN